MLKLLLLALAVLPVAAHASPWVLDPETRIVAEVGWQGAKVEVRFPTVSATIDFDADRPETAKATISVATTNATTGLAPADQLLRGKDYLDVATFPEIAFRLDKLTRLSSSSAEIDGRITLRGVTKPIRFDATVVRYGKADNDPSRSEAGFDLTGSIDRTEFGSTGGVPQMAAVLPIRIHLLMHSQ